MVSSFFFFFATPILSGRRLDVYYTSTHDVALCANLECRSEMCCTRFAENRPIQDAKITQKSSSAHHRTTLSGYIFATKACNDNRKELLNNNTCISSTCLHNMVNFGPLTAEIGRRVWGTPANFNRFGVLTSLFLRSDQTNSIEGATYIRLGGHHVGHRPTL